MTVVEVSEKASGSFIELGPRSTTTDERTTGGNLMIGNPVGIRFAHPDASSLFHDNDTVTVIGGDAVDDHQI